MTLRERNSAICAAYHAGERAPALALRFGIATPTVWKILKAEGATLPPAEQCRRRSETLRRHWREDAFREKMRGCAA